MQHMTTWWRDVAGLLVACALALVVVAPVASSSLCLCADDAAMSQGVAQGAQATATDELDAGQPCEAACCVGGHCHHGGPMLSPAAAMVSELAPVGTRPSLAIGRTLTSLAPSSLDRPPRI